MLNGTLLFQSIYDDGQCDCVKNVTGLCANDTLFQGFFIGSGHYFFPKPSSLLDLAMKLLPLDISLRPKM